MAVKWPVITEGVTKATKSFFEEIFKGAEEDVTAETTRAETSEATKADLEGGKVKETELPSSVVTNGSQSSPILFIESFGAVGDGVTNDSGAFVKAFEALGSGGVLELGANTYYINLSVLTKGLEPSDGVTIRGRGRKTCLLAGPTLSGTVQTQLFNLSGTARVELRDLRLEGPSAASLSAEQYIDAVKHNGEAPGAIILRNVLIKQFRYSTFIPGFTSGTGKKYSETLKNAAIDVDGCEFEGLSGSASHASMGVLHQAASGNVVVRNTYIHHMGKEGDVHNHCIYVGRGVNAQIVGCQFDYLWGGRYIQFEDQIADLSTAGTYPDIQAIIGCRFGRNYTGGEGQVITSSWGSPTIIIGCQFNQPGKCIYVRADAIVSDCIFRPKETGKQTIWCDNFKDEEGFSAPTFYKARAIVRGCEFLGAAKLNIGIEPETGIVADWLIESCRFNGEAGPMIYVPQRATKAVVRVQRNIFQNEKVAFAKTIELEGGERVIVSDNDFCSTQPEKQSISTETGHAPATLEVFNNNFSESESVKLPAVPVTLKVEGNHGYRNRNGGTASIKDAGKISHHLGEGGTALTPTSYTVTPTNAAHIACVTAVSSTELTVALKVASSGAAVEAAENVVWRAEY